MIWSHETVGGARLVAALAARQRKAASPISPTAPASRASAVFALLRLRAGLDLLDDGRIGKRRRVAELALLRHVPEQAAHDLAAPRLRQLGREDDVRRLRDRPDLAADVVAKLLEHLDRAVVAALQAHVGDDRLAGPLVLAP